MSYEIAGNCCQVCFGSDNEEKQLHWKVKFSEQLEVALRTAVLFSEEGFLDNDEYYQHLMLYAESLSTCHECERKKPEAFLLIQKEYIIPHQKKLKEEKKHLAMIKKIAQANKGTKLNNVSYLFRNKI